MATKTQIGIEYALYGLNYAVRNNYRPTSGNVYLPVCVCMRVSFFFFFLLLSLSYMELAMVRALPQILSNRSLSPSLRRGRRQGLLVLMTVIALLFHRTICEKKKS